MKRQIRQGVFETNSSSEHSIAVVACNDYERWKEVSEQLPLMFNHKWTKKDVFDFSIRLFGYLEYDK